jgi:hypothetical protein
VRGHSGGPEALGCRRPGTPPDLPEFVGRAFGELADQPGEQLFLAPEIVVERWAREAGGIGDVLEAGAREATVGEQPGGFFHDLALHQVPPGTTTSRRSGSLRLANRTPGRRGFRPLHVTTHG